jgi:hypothetical protein
MDPHRHPFFPSLSFRSAPSSVHDSLKKKLITLWCGVVCWVLPIEAHHILIMVWCVGYTSRCHGYPSTTRHKCPSYIVEQVAIEQTDCYHRTVFLYICLAKWRENCTFHQIAFIVFHKSSHGQIFYIFHQILF